MTLIAEPKNLETESIYYWLPVVSMYTYLILLYFYCQYKKDNSIIDTNWGLTFIISNWSILIYQWSSGQRVSARSILSNTLIAIWGLRLAYHIGARHVTEDYRYVNMRNRWMAKSETYYYFAAFFYIFIMQGLFSLVTNAAGLYITVYSNPEQVLWSQLNWLDYLGASVWLFGFVFEVIGDMQLKQHLADKTLGKKKFITWGLWRYTRHPNYFGEAVLWWGIWLIACSIEDGWATFFAPLFIGLLIRYVSGVPLLEKKYIDNSEFKHTMKTTNVFFPWFHKEVIDSEDSIFQPLVDKTDG